MLRLLRRTSTLYKYKHFSTQTNKLAYISDIHLELWKNKMPIITEDKNIHGLALLGDIGNPFEKNYRDFLLDCSNKFNNIYLLAGNHEYYHTVDKLPNLRNYVIDRILHVVHDINKTTNNNNIIFLDNNYISIKHNDQRHLLIGSTLWSHHNVYSKGPNTPQFIIDYNNFLNHQHFYSLEWITRLLHKIKIYNEMTKENVSATMMTHYVPSKQLIEQRFLSKRSQLKYKESPDQNRFFSNLDHLINDPLKHWLCGHTHSHMTKYINNVECGINTVGYVGKEFNNENKELQLEYVDLFPV